MSKITNLLMNEKAYKFGKVAAGAIYATTALKAIGRPAFIYADKNSDKETKKYTAAKEFLYQILCLGITIGILPLFKMGGFKLAQKNLKNIKEFSNIKGVKSFEQEFKNIDKYSDSLKEKLKLTNGGVELGSFVGSVLGLTIIAPLISHKILHPVMHAIGFDKKESPNPALEKLQQPILTEGHHKLDKQV